MASVMQHHTRQGRALLDFLESVRSRHFTASQIKTSLDARGVNMGMATIYRQMDRLVQEGVVRKYTLDIGDSACYEYVGRETATDCTSHFHCKCEQCGTLIHMDCDELQAIQSHLQQEHGFRWNAGRTVFYGVCAQCQAHGA